MPADYLRGALPVQMCIRDRQEIIDLALQQVVPVRKALGLRGEGWVAERYGSLPYLLVRAYGGCYLWPVLTDVLHRRPLSGRRFAAGAASRMNGLAKESLLGPSEMCIRDRLFAFYVP